MAPLTRGTKVDEAASPARAPRYRSGGSQADPLDGQGEPPVGLPEDQGRARKARGPRFRDEYRDAAPPLRRRSGSPPGHWLARVPEGSGGGYPRVRLLHGRDGVPADPLRPVLHRDRDTARARHGLNDQPGLFLRHPAGKEPRDEPRRRGHADRPVSYTHLTLPTIYSV